MSHLCLAVVREHHRIAHRWERPGGGSWADFKMDLKFKQTSFINQLSEPLCLPLCSARKRTSTIRSQIRNMVVLTLSLSLSFCMLVMLVCHLHRTGSGLALPPTLQWRDGTAKVINMPDIIINNECSIMLGVIFALQPDISIPGPERSGRHHPDAKGADAVLLKSSCTQSGPDGSRKQWRECVQRVWLAFSNTINYRAVPSDSLAGRLNKQLPTEMTGESLNPTILLRQHPSPSHPIRPTSGDGQEKMSHHTLSQGGWFWAGDGVKYETSSLHAAVSCVCVCGCVSTNTGRLHCRNGT